MTPYPVTDNLLLATIYGGIIGGIGSGLLYRAGGTVGGTSIIGRILQNKTGMPLSQTTSLLMASSFCWQASSLAGKLLCMAC